MQDDVISRQSLNNYRPTTAYIGATWAVLAIGALAYLFGLWNATGMAMSEKGYYVAVIALGLYSAISLQKTVRDKAEGIPTSMLYYWISWSALGLSVGLIVIGLLNADGLSLSEKGFYMMAFTMSLFAAITIQKNTRDQAQLQALQMSDQSFLIQDDSLDNAQSTSTPASLEHTYTPDAQNSKESGSLFGSIRAKQHQSSE